jgi:plasmid stabilization system protein ParE
MTYDFHPEARMEYREAAVFYETSQPGFGALFTLEIEATIERILESPKRWPVIEQDVRRCLSHTFPYGILYTIEANESVLILAVMHLRRRPGYWRRRLPDSE